MTDTVRGLLADAAARLGGDEGRREAEWLLGHTLARPRSWLFAHAGDAVSAGDAQRFRAMVEARRDGWPVAYLTGRRGFWTLDLEVGPGVLIPRPETELLVELALARLAPRGDVADLGTGSGAIALALASERPELAIVATDASPEALAIARGNARRLGLANVTFAEGSWCAALGARRFQLIASNPPYIAAGDPHLGQGDLRHEPALALASGADGLDAIRTITACAPAHLEAGGWLLLEHGHDQGTAVRDLLRAAGFAGVESVRDLAGRERVSLGRRA